jgi:hypothetical protein
MEFHNLTHPNEINFQSMVIRRSFCIALDCQGATGRLADKWIAGSFAGKNKNSIDQQAGRFG